MYLAVELLENLRHQVRLLTKNHASESAQLPETAQKNNNLYSRNHHKRRIKNDPNAYAFIFKKSEQKASLFIKRSCRSVLYSVFLFFSN